MLLQTAATCEDHINLLPNVTPKYFCLSTCDNRVSSIGCLIAGEFVVAS